MGSLSIKGLRKAYGPVDVIKGVDLSIKHGEFVVFVGPSGCGKSTLLRMIAGLEEISSGELRINDVVVNDFAPVKRGISMVFQSYALYPHMTVFENIAFPLRVAKASSGEIESLVNKAAKILKLEDRLQHKPSQLSGGQRQRVAIGRAIVRAPEVFLFDEPLSNLDAALRAEMRVELTSLHRDLGATMIYVTHDQVEAMTMADRIVVLDKGGISQVGSPLDLYHRPQNMFVAGFIGNPKMNFIPVTYEGRTAGSIVVRLPGGSQFQVPADPAAEGDWQNLILGIRPEHIRLEPNDTVLDVIPHVVEKLGIHTVSYSKVDGNHDVSITTLASGSLPHQPGERFRVGFKAADCHLFDERGLAINRRHVVEGGPIQAERVQ
ncbi:ABC transporter ATP-binding protein [Rhizobium sp. TRM95796]|uniref:ABC transporter ATP-binding protein n=1 Tax=Rhizobium sp. TRM95796 TaxID=2979862 RepID=UPI0021E7FE8F|nr:sn-glycerol-3-phosphate ABC transporter ATP-binding protein UgpC [Rhizobium sp. TRM95796]MCV3768139.1 sn-glycerol-3-phosphate ABC transporter ATP-binding protein UgpC [Rhizobium sp. TRM95796]